MIDEAINNVWEKAMEAMVPIVTQLPGDPDHVQHIFKPDGEIERVLITPPDRLVYVERLQDLIALAIKPLDTEEEVRPAITYDAASVVYLANTEHGRIRTVYRLDDSDEFEFFQGLHATKTPLVSVQDLRHALRITLARTFTDDSLIDKVSRLAIEDRQRSDESRQAGRESIDTSVLKQVQPETVLPDPNQVFNVRRFGNYDISTRHVLDCIIEPDMQTRKWFVKPIAESFYQFDWDTVEEVGNTIRDALAAAKKTETVRVWRGTYYQEPHTTMK